MVSALHGLIVPSVDLSHQKVTFESQILSGTYG